MEFGIDILAARAEHQYRLLQAERRARVTEAMSARPKGRLLRWLAQRVTVSLRWRPAPVRRAGRH